MLKVPGVVVLLDMWSCCPTAWRRRRWLSPGSHQLSVPCLFRFLPEIKEKSQEELKQPRAAAWPRCQLPVCALQPSGTVRPRDLPALCPLWALGRGRRGSKSCPPSQRPCPAQAQETNAACVGCAWSPGNELPLHREGRETAAAADGVQAPRGGSGRVAPVLCPQNRAEHGARPGTACSSAPQEKGLSPGCCLGGSLCKSHASAEASGAAPALGGWALGVSSAFAEPLPPCLRGSLLPSPPAEKGLRREAEGEASGGGEMPKPCEAESLRGAAGRAAAPGQSLGRVSVCRLPQRPGKALGGSQPWTGAG